MVANENFNLELQNEDEEFIVNFGETTVLGSGGGAVSSVNGHTGDVVLTTSDLENTSDYQTGGEVETAIGSAITDKQDKLTAGDNITISEQNVISATDTTYSDFTGTDGTTAGTAGLVPAPATTDVDKFLKSNGTWSEAGGGATGEAKELMSADYNWNWSAQNATTTPFDTVALWLLEPGMYYSKSGVKVATSKTAADTGEGAYLIGVHGWYTDIIKNYPGGGNNGSFYWYKTATVSGVAENVGNSTYVSPLTGANIKNSTGTSTTDVMSQSAVTGMVFQSENSGKVRIANTKNLGLYSVGIGAMAGSYAAGVTGSYSVGVGTDISVEAFRAVAIGKEATVSSAHTGGVALGACSKTSSAGEVNIGSTEASYGYNNSNYRLLSGLYDPQSAHDAATKGYVDAISSYSESEVNTGVTWIDGKTIYKKSYSVTLPNGSIYNVNTGITNMYEVVKIEAIWHASGTLTTGMPTTYAVASDAGNSNTISVITYGGTTIEITHNNRSGTKGVITLYYTKSS